MNITHEEYHAILDALIFTVAGDACCGKVDEKSMRSAIEKLAHRYDYYTPRVYLWGEEFDDEENSNFVKNAVKNIGVKSYEKLL